MTSQTPKDSPSLPDTPFKAFLESPVSKQVSKFQEIAKEYSRKTLATKLELDQERADRLSLRKELERKNKEVANMRQSLLVARQDLHSLDERAREEQKFQEEMTRLKEHKEHQKATDTMQLKTILVELDEEKSKTRQLESENSKLGEKMKELNSRLEVLTTQNQDLEIGDTFMKNEIKMLKTLNDERSTEIQQLQEMVNELQSRTKDRLNESSINMSFSMPENLGDVLATDFQSKVNELEELTEQLKDQNAQLAKQGEEMKITIENLENKVKGKEAMEEQIRQLEHNTADLVEQRDSLKEKTDKIQNEFELRENGYLTQLKEMEKLKETLDTKAYDLEQESARVTDFQLKVNELEELTEQLRTHNEELVKQGEERILAIEDLEQKAQGREAIEDQVKQLEYQNAELDKQRESFKASANKFQSELEVKENEYLKQLKEKDGIKDILASKSCEVEQLSAQVSEFQSKINELEDITEQFKNHNAELVAQDEEKTMAIQSLEKRAQDKEAIEDQAKQLEQHNAELVQQRESLKDTANKLQSELQIKESEYLKKLKEKDSMEEILESKVSELDQQRAHIKDFQSKVYELEGLTEQMKNHNAELVTQCEEKVKAIQNLEERAQGKEALENSVKQLELHNAELVQQKEILKESVDKFQSELEVTESEYLKQMKERDSMREILDGKVYELEQKSIQVSDFQSKVIELEEQTEQLKNHNAELVTHGAEKVKAIQNLEERARGKEDMEDQVNELKRHNAELLQEKKVLKESVDQFQSELGVRESEFLKQMKERDSMKEILESKVYELEQKSVQVSDFQSKVIELEEQTEQLKNHNAELVTQAAEKMQAIQNLEERAQGQEAMVDQVMQLENQNAELVEQKENLQADANKFQSELEMMKSGYLNQLKQKDSMKEVLESKVSELEQQRSQVMCRNENILQEKENVLQEKENLIVELKKILRDRDNDHEKEIEELKVAHEQSNKKMEAKHAEQRAQMKEKLQSKLKEAGNIMQTKYNEKLEQYAGEKDQEVSEIRKSESKFSKMAEELQKKYNASKAILTEKVTENKKLRAEVEELRKKLGRQDQPTKQKAVATPGPSNDVFKAPKLQAPKNTPGRSKPGRTQSDIQIKAPSRRPPLGTGNLFTMDDEQGEMFSNSYLSELKSGKCSMDNSGRISELARRNSMVPAHLQSSYPAETQYYKSNLFSDDALRKGNVQEITDKTAKLTFDSPAANTRTQRKRRSEAHLDPPAMNAEVPVHGKRLRRETSSLSTTSTLSVKEEKAAANHTSYSRPGVPTPAKGKRHNQDTSLNRSNNRSLNSTHDKTPLLDTTNMTNVSTTSSNKSMTARIIGTPKSLKRNLTRAFTKRKYDVKGKNK